MSARRLEELRRGYPTDATLQNLLTVVSGQLQLCARLPVYEYEAASDAHEQSAAVFRALAIAEQSHVEDLLVALRHHLAAREARAAGEKVPDPMTATEGAPR
jgi:hypothetical protein